MKKDDFVVPKRPTQFKIMCDEHEISYKDIALSSGVAYHNIAKYATSVCKPTEETLAKLNKVCEPIFGKRLTLEDFGFQAQSEASATGAAATGNEPEVIAWEPAPEPEPAKKPTRKQTRKKGGRTKAKAVAKPKPEEPETETKAVTIRAAVEYLSSGYVLRDGEGWSECFKDKEDADRALMEHIDCALNEGIDLGLMLEIKVRPVTDPSEFYNLKRV